MNRELQGSSDNRSKQPRVALFCAADQFYVIQLAVMLSTCLRNYSNKAPLDIFVVDGGLSPEQREKVEKSLPKDRAVITWCLPRELPAAKFFVSNHITISTYYRLFLENLIPEQFERVVYIDVDTAVLGDIKQLFDAEMEQSIVLARPQLAPSDWSFSPRESYFNAGVLVIDTPRWRGSTISQRALEFAAQNGARNTEWDQGALNVVLSGSWGGLLNSWNAEPTKNTMATLQSSANSKDSIHVLHFLGVAKPWHANYPDRDLQEFYFALVDQTQWKGWRPARGFEYLLRKIGGTRMVASFLDLTRTLRKSLGLNYSNLYRFFRERTR